MQTLNRIHSYLQCSLIHNQGLLNCNTGINLAKPNSWGNQTFYESDLNDWEDFSTLDKQARILFEACGYRLGILAEAVFENWLKLNQIKYFRGIQVFESGTSPKTLGELDFIYFLENQWIHLELAAKVYCFRPQMNDFIGPNRRDFMHLKLRSLRNHQLPLIKHPSTTRILNAEGVTRVESSNVHFCGRIFYPTGSWKIPEYIHPDHLKGTYYEKELPLADFPKKNVLMLLPRYLWFAPKINLTALEYIALEYSQFAPLYWINLQNPSQTKRFSQIIEDYRSSGQTLMLSMLQWSSNQWQEIERILFVPKSLS